MADLSCTNSHVGICVSDVERSRKFYSEVFGFKVCALMTPGKEMADLVDLHGELAAKCQFLEKAGFLIELVEFTQPGYVGTKFPRPANKLGLTHLSFRVRDADGLAEKMLQYGGSVNARTRTVYNDPPPGISGIVLFGADPDGTRIELMQIPDAIQFK